MHFPLLTDKQGCLEVLVNWCEINSGSKEENGLLEMQQTLKEAFFCLGGVIEEIPLAPRIIVDIEGRLNTFTPPPLLKISKRPGAARQLIFLGHYDTVFDKSHPFQKVQYHEEDGILQGPGVADMKGGLLVLLLGLRSFEESRDAKHLGWTILLNPDEEVGSQSSAAVIEKECRGKEFGLVFEPAPGEDLLIVERGGSATFRLHAKGEAAHAGRDPDKGKSAILGLLYFCLNLESKRKELLPAFFNIGVMHGGTSANVIPENGWLRFNLRWKEEKDFKKSFEAIQISLTEAMKKTGVSLELVEEVKRPPKPFDKKTKTLFQDMQNVAKGLGISLKEKCSFGVSDGNLLAANGVPNLDTMGVVGHGLHTSEEKIHVNSINERARLFSAFLTYTARNQHGA